AFEPDKVIAVGDHVLNDTASAVGHDFLERCVCRRSHNLRADLPAGSPLGVCPDNQALSHVRHRIFVTRLAFDDSVRSSGGTGKVEQPYVRYREGGGLGYQEAVRKRHLRGDGARSTALHVDARVRHAVRTELVAIDLLAPLHWVSADVE